MCIIEFSFIHEFYRINLSQRSDFFYPSGPQGWNKDRVIKWIDDVCDEYEIDPNDVSNLKTLSGRGLMKLKRKDWIGRSPKQGDLLYNLWHELSATSAVMNTGENIKKSPPISPRKGIFFH